MDDKFARWGQERIGLLGEYKREGLIQNPWALRTLAQAMGTSAPSPAWRRAVEALQLKKAFNSSPFPLPDSSVDGPIRIAVAANGQPIGLTAEEARQGFVVGRTGSGKTLLTTFLQAQAIKAGAQVWIFEKEGHEAWSLIDLCPNLLIQDFQGQVPWNPYNPCSVSLDSFVSHHVDTLGDSHYLLEVSRDLLRTTLHTLFREVKQPTQQDLLDAVLALRFSAFDRMQRGKESIVARLRSMDIGGFAKTCAWSRGVEESLLGMNAVFSIGHLPRSLQTYVVNTLITLAYLHRLHAGSVRPMLIFVDDALLLVPKSGDFKIALGVPVISDLLSNVRKSKLGLVLSTQNPSQAGAAIHANAAVCAMLSLASGEDIETMLRNFGCLTREQREYCYRLKPREILIRNSFRYPTPVLGIVPEFPEPRQVSVDEAWQHNQAVLSRIPVPVPRVSKSEARMGTSETRTSSSGQRPKQAPSEKPKAATVEQVDDELKAYVMTAWTNQGKSSATQVAKLAGLPLGTGSRVGQRCAEEGFIRFVQMPFGRGSAKYPIVLDKGLKLLGVKERASLGRGASHEHSIAQFLVARWFAEFHPEVELRRGGKFIDVGLDLPTGLVAIEIAHTAKHERVNIERDIEDAWARYVVIACWDDKVLAQVRGIISSLDPALARKTRAVLISEILRRNPEQFFSSLAQEEALP